MKNPVSSINLVVPGVGRRNFSALIAFSLLVIGLKSYTSRGESVLISTSEPFIAEKGPHHRAWQKTESYRLPDGAIVTQTRPAYVELASGLHYFSGGEWQPSREEFEIFPGGAVARNAQHQLIVSPSIADVPAFDLQGPSGTRLKSRIFGVAYFCAATGRSVLLGEIKESTGELTAPNEVTWRDCFTDDVKADVRSVFRLSGTEMHVILRQQLPPCQDWLIDPEHCRVQIWTEIFDPPVPTKKQSIIRSEQNPALRALMQEPDFSDELIAFADVHFTRGKAFAIENEAVRAAGIDVDVAAPVGKKWAVIRDQVTGLNRSFMVESLEYSGIRPLIETLPLAGGNNENNRTIAGMRRGRGNADFTERNEKNKESGRTAAKTPEDRSLLTSAATGVSTKKRKVVSSAGELIASASKRSLDRRAGSTKPPKGGTPNVIKVVQSALDREPGMLVDLITLNSSLTNYTFESLQTYYISAPVLLYSNNICEGNAVLKFAPTNSAKIDVKGKLTFNTDLYRNAVLTARDDHNQGEKIGSVSLNGVYADTALRFDYNTSSELASVTNVKVMYARRGLEFVGGHGHDARHVQFVNCGTALHVDGATAAIQNGLGWNLTNALVGASSSTSTGVWEHATFDQVTNLVTDATGAFTNCLVVGVVTTNGLTGSPNSVVASSNGVFAVVGGGSHYLSDDSYRNLGSNTVVGSEIQKRTTYKPLVLTNTIAVDTTLSPQAGRDTDTPDMGWHYAPLDWWACGVTVNSNVTLLLTNGAAVGMDYVSNSWGFILKSAHLVSVGGPTALNRLVRADTVQEKSGGNPGTRAFFYDGSTVGTDFCDLRLRFTEFSQLANGGYMIYVGSKFDNIEWSHCRFYNPLIVMSASTSALNLGITNCLFERGDVNFSATAPFPSVVHLRNNLFRYRVLHFTGTNTWTLRDNLFDSLSALIDNGKPVENSYNAYFNTTWGLSGGSNNTNLTSLTYEAGPLGAYYQPTNSVLINLGSQNATNSGLYHFCSTTNQVKETNSVVDITGIHYVALDANGNPLDADSDGYPDYLEDTNGNGAVDSGETDWQNAGDWGLKVWITRPQNNSIIP